MYVFIDYETYSDIDIKKAGAWAYSLCPHAKVLMMAWAIEDGPIHVWEPGQVLPGFCSHPNDFTIVAHNAEFEYAIWNNVFVRLFGVPKLLYSTVNCTAVRAASIGIPRSLEDSSKALNLRIKKQPDGLKLIKLFCCPAYTPSGTIVRGASPQMFPNEWHRFRSYCVDDVGAMREGHKVLPELIDSEREAFIAHLKINELGIRVDRNSVDLLDKLADRAQEFYKATEHGGILGSPVRLVSTLSLLGCEVNDCRQDTLERALNDPSTPYAAKELISQRLEFSKTSLKKLKRIQIADSGDHRMRGMHVFFGAHTGRFSGAVVQLQNLVRASVDDPEKAIRELHSLPNDLDDMIACYGGPGPFLEHATKLIRPMFMAPPGKEFIVYDFKCIEALNVFWLCGATHMLDLYRNGHDAYRFMASLIFHQPAESFDSKGIERFVGKQTVLGCGYGMGWRKFIVHCLVLANWIVEESLAKQAVNSYRSNIPQVPQGWKAFDETVAALFQIRGTGGIELFGGKLLMWIVWDETKTVPMCLCCRDPSGSIMRWHHPCYVQVPSENVGQNDEMVLTYLTHRKLQTKGQQIIQNLIAQRCEARGLDKAVYLSRIPKGMDGWTRITIWGGKFMENLIQKISRNMLVASQIRCQNEGYDIVLHAHDENVFEVPKKNIEYHMETLHQLMIEPPAWAKDAYIEVEGWHGTRYTKR